MVFKAFWQANKGQARRAAKSKAARRDQHRRRRYNGLETLEPRALLAASAVFPPNDAFFPEQWNLQNTGQVGGTAGEDINVGPVINQGITGQGVVVGVVDTGVDSNHPDLAANYVAGLSYNYLEGLNSPIPPEPLPEGADHGTEMAGIIAGVANNTIGVSGVAPGAQFAGLRAIGTASGSLAPGTDQQISNAESAHQQQIQIYNNSWTDDSSVLGPNGTPLNVPTVRNDYPLTLAAIQQGVTKGRGLLGNIYVFPGGDGGAINDNVNYSSLTNSPNVIAVGGVNQQGLPTQYGTPGAALLVSAPTGDDVAGAGDESGLPTTDIVDGPFVNGNPTLIDTYVGNDQNGATGTGAAAAEVSGVIALMLQANPKLSYRDVQMILAESARQNDSGDPNWTYNGASFTSDGAVIPTAEVGATSLPTGVTVSPFHFNNQFGFGVVDAAEAVALAKTWTPLQPLVTLSSGTTPMNGILVPDGAATGVQSSVHFTEGLHVEHAQVTVQLAPTVAATPADQDLQITLISPNGTRSVLAAQRTNDTATGQAGGTSNADYTTGWTFSTNEDWGESSAGQWTIQVADRNANGVTDNFTSWSLVLSGTDDYAPIAQDFSVSAPQGTTTPFNVLSHTYDTDGTYYIAPGSLKILSQPAGGTLSVDPQTGQVQYTPAPGFFGTDHFTYSVTDNNGVSSRVATVSLTVGQVVAAPVAHDIQAATAIGAPVSVDILANVTDNSGTIAPSNINITRQPNFGTLSINPNTGVATYTPGPNFVLTDRFTYQVTDSNNLTSNVATVTINLAEATPVASSFNQPAAPENVTQQVNVLGHVSGSSSPGGVTVVTAPLHGTTLVDPVTGVVNYTPAVNFFGSDSFRYAVANTQGALSNTATVTLTVLPQGVPIALSHEFVLAPDGAVMNGIRALDDPTNSGGLSASLVSPAHFGSVVLYPDGSFTYVRGAGFPSIDSFSYVENNGQNNSNVGTIRLVTPDVNYIESLYRVLFNRTASDADLTAWAAVLAAGVSRQQVVTEFLGSPEYLSIFIQNGYQQLLKRPVDPAGLYFWLTQMESGLSREQFDASLAGSPEYFADHGYTAAGLITGYYNDFLGRSPSANDLAYWTNQLQSGAPGGLLALTIMNSPESHNEFVMNLYQSYFGAPISAGAAANLAQSLMPNVSRLTLQVAVLSGQQFYLSGLS